MRVISKFKDYYDVVAGQGVDLTRVYMRETKFIHGRLPIKGFDETKHWGNNSRYGKYADFHHGIYTQGWAYYSHELHYVYVLFAGKLYGGLKFVNNTNSSSRYLWDMDSLDALLEEVNMWPNKPYISKYRRDKTPAEPDYEVCKRIFAIRGDEILREWAVENNIAIALGCGDLTDRNPNAPIYPITQSIKAYAIEPCLKDISFQKVLDPFTAYQELDMWIGGVLTKPETIPEPADKDKVAIHGFDPKWSFRKHKLDNK
jgi:hypothetical protein